MRKILLLTVLSAFFAVGATSCKKCITCTYTFGGQTYSSGEVCGNKDDIDAVEAQWEAAGTLAGVTTSCVK